MLLLLLLLALLSFLAPSSTMLPRWILCKFLLQLPLRLLLLLPLHTAVPSLATRPLPLVAYVHCTSFCCCRHSRGQSTRQLDCWLAFVLPHSLAHLSLSLLLCFLIFMHCSCLALFTFVFRVFWWLAKFNFNSICSQQQQQQQQREQPLISWLSWKALKSMLQISVSNSLFFFPLSLCGLKLIGILQLTR